MTAVPLLDYYALMMVGTVFAILLAAMGVLVALIFLDSTRGRQLIRRRLARRLATTRFYGKLKKRGISPPGHTGVKPPAGMRIHLRTGNAARDASYATTRRPASKPTTERPGAQGRARQKDR